MLSWIRLGLLHSLDRCHRGMNSAVTGCARPWASAHRANGVSWPPWKNGWKITKRKHAKKSTFPCLRYILRAIREGRCRERRYADHIFIQIYFRMHHFVVKFSKFSSPQAARGIDPLSKIMRTFLRSLAHLRQHMSKCRPPNITRMLPMAVVRSSSGVVPGVGC